MKCPKCNMQINLIDNEDFTDSQCPHCEFYFYLRHILRIAYIASFMVDENENIYFKNIHERIYSPFIKRYEEQLSARRGAIIVASYLKKKRLKAYCTNTLKKIYCL